MGRIHLKLMEDDLALTRFGEALTIRQSCLGRDHEAVGHTVYNMADIYSRKDRFAISMEMYAEALRIQLQTEGKESASVAMILLKMGALLAREGLHWEAMEKLRASLRIRTDRVNRLGMASRVVSNVGDLAEDYMTIMNKDQDTVERDNVRKALHQEAIKEEVALSVVYHCMGNVYLKQHERIKAKNCFEQSLRVRRRHPVKIVMSPEGSIKLHAADTLHNLGSIYELEGNHEVALKYYAVALKLKHGFSVPASKRVESSVEKTSELVIYSGVSSLDGSYLEFPGTLSYAATLGRIGSVHFQMKNSEIAAACFGGALAIQKRHLGNDHFIVARTLSDMGAALKGIAGRRGEALECFRESYRIPQPNARTLDKGQLLYHMGKLYDLDRDYTRAVTCYRQAIEVYGHRYVNAAGRNLCRYLLLGHHALVTSEERDDGDSAFSKNIFKMEAISPTVQMEGSSSAPALTAIAGALFRASRRQDGLGDESIVLDLDLNAPDCWVSLELYLLSLHRLLKSIAAGWHSRATSGMREVLHHLEHVGQDAIVRGQDNATFQMLCLIQE
jgi:tetratricopeptide (TPR) repeat protein